jgi:hypothetical protein
MRLFILHNLQLEIINFLYKELVKSGVLGETGTSELYLKPNFQNVFRNRM